MQLAHICMHCMVFCHVAELAAEHAEQQMEIERLRQEHEESIAALRTANEDALAEVWQQRDIYTYIYTLCVNIPLGCILQGGVYLHWSTHPCLPDTPCIYPFVSPTRSGVCTHTPSSPCKTHPKGIFIHSVYIYV